MLLETHTHAHADVHRVGLTTDDVRGEPEPRLVVELDDRHDVGRIEAGNPASTSWIRTPSGESSGNNLPSQSRVTQASPPQS